MNEKREEYYFAYGSNLSMAQMGKRGCQVIGKPVKGVLEGYRLGFTRNSSRWNGGVADVLQSESKNSVKGVVYEVNDVKPMDIHEVCKWGKEKNSAYYRKKMTVQTDKGPIEAWVYYVVQKKAFVQPDIGYVKQMVNGQFQGDGGLRGFGFSEQDVKEVCAIAQIPYASV
jgi:cation transport regulator ChaC